MTKLDPRRITADQTARLPEFSRTVLQAVEYRDIGASRVDGWIDSALKGVRTGTGRKIAEAALTISPLAWRER